MSKELAQQLVGFVPQFGNPHHQRAVADLKVLKRLGGTKVITPSIREKIRRLESSIIWNIKQTKP